MHALDDWILGLGGGGLTLGLVVALLLGARHATDADHLTAVSTLILSDDRRGGRRAGYSASSGASVTRRRSSLFGMPIVMFGAQLAGVSSAERLSSSLGSLRRFSPFVCCCAGVVATSIPIRTGTARFVTRTRTSTSTRGRPVTPLRIRIVMRKGMGRSPAAAFGIGLMHGLGGSAGVGILLVASVADRVNAVAGLLLFAAATALSMAVVSAAVGYGLVRGPIAVRLERVVPMFGAASLVFGVWYAMGALRPLG